MTDLEALARHWTYTESFFLSFPPLATFRLAIIMIEPTQESIFTIYSVYFAHSC